MTTAPPNMPPPRRQRDLRSVRRSRWFQPLFAVFLGVVVLVVMSVGGQSSRGAVGLGVLAAFGAFLLLGGRSDTIRGLRGDGRDERFEMMRLRAAGLAGRVVVLAVVVAYLIRVGQGHSGAPYGWLSALAGITFLVSFGYLRWRS
jgi:drug/metabolite transporter (DMT)-like permease